MEAFFLGLTVLALGAGLAARRRLHLHTRRRTARRRLSNDDVREIEEHGRLSNPKDKPLDMEDIRGEEDRFWSETWDEPERL